MSAGSYLVNRVAQSNGDHEVHLSSCSYLPANYMPLGYHAGCKTAVMQARLTFPRSNGCYWCSSECHTS
jgi:hypothetical protein